MAKRLSKSDVYKMVMDDYTMFYRPMPDEIKALFPVITIEILEDMGFHFTKNHTGKMVGMQSISTTCKCNADCIKRIAKAYAKLEIDTSDIKAARKAFKKYIKQHALDTNICICAMCFSDSQQDMQKSMQIPLIRNYNILNNGIIRADWLPVLNCMYFRGESFGDFASSNATINVMNIAKKNPHVNVTAWTKNLVFFGEAINNRGYEKPDNFKLIMSSPFINKVATIPKQFTGIVNAVFTVFTEEYAVKHNITINCGARACLACLRCYTGFDGNIKYVNELLK